MAQTRYSRGFDYEVPPPLVSCLVHRSTWDLFCLECGRHAYPNVVDLIARYGDDFDSEVIWRRSVCKVCGDRMKVAGGMFVKRLQEPPAIYHRMVMPAPVERPDF